MKLNFKLPSTIGQDRTLDDFKGKYIVLYFNPKDNTSGRTLEALDFTK